MDEVRVIQDERTNGGKLTPFTHANARLAAQKSAEVRRNKAAQAARNRTVARLAASDPSIQTAYDAWGELVADQAEALRQAASDGKPRGDDLLRVGQAMQMLAQPHERTAEAGAGAGATLTLSPDIARALVDQLVQARASVADGQVVGDGQAETDAEADKEQG